VFKVNTLEYKRGSADMVNLRHTVALNDAAADLAHAINRALERYEESLEVFGRNDREPPEQWCEDEDGLVVGGLSDEEVLRAVGVLNNLASRLAAVGTAASAPSSKRRKRGA
jgi:hypothetical protein